MIKTSIEKLAHEIGFDIGNSDDITQGKLLNGLADGLCNSMNDSSFSTQICYLQAQLNKKSVRVIKELYGFIELSEKE